MPVEVPVPRSGPKPQICVWCDFSLKNIDELKLLQQPDEVKRKISEILGLADGGEDTKNKIITDLFYFAYIFANDCNFNEEQVSALLSILKRTHEKAVDSPYGNIDDAFEYFKELLLKHCVKRPPFSMQLYNMAEAKKITDYVLETYFKHYKLYKYAFTPKLFRAQCIEQAPRNLEGEYRGMGHFAKVRLDLTFEYKGLPEEPEVPEGGFLENEEASNSNVEDEDTQETEKDEAVEQEEPAAVKELKAMINSTLNEHVHKLKLNMDQQLKANEEAILKKITEVTGVERGPSRKSKKK